MLFQHDTFALYGRDHELYGVEILGVGEAVGAAEDGLRIHPAVAVEVGAPERLRAAVAVVQPGAGAMAVRTVALRWIPFSDWDSAMAEAGLLARDAHAAGAAEAARLSRAALAQAEAPADLPRSDLTDVII